MISTLAALLRSAVWRRCREFGSATATLIAVVSLGTISLGFASFAAFAQLRSVVGAVSAATIMAGVYAATAILVAAVQALRQRVSRPHAASPPSMSAMSASSVPMTLRLREDGAMESQALLIQAMKLGGELSTTQFLVVALLGGFLTGRAIRK